jgi:hypothetical protein
LNSIRQSSTSTRASSRLLNASTASSSSRRRPPKLSLPGRPRLDEAGASPGEAPAVAQGVGGQLRTVVTAKELQRGLALGDQALQHRDGGVGIDPPFDGDRQGLAGVLVHDVEQLQDPTVQGLSNW